MLIREDWNNQVLTAFCKRDDSYPPIVKAFLPADESSLEQAIDRRADGPDSEVDFRLDCVHWQRTRMQQSLGSPCQKCPSPGFLYTDSRRPLRGLSSKRASNAPSLKALLVIALSC